MQYYLNDEEVSFLDFRSSLKEAMEHLYGEMWIGNMVNNQIDYIVENMERNHSQVNINHNTYLVERV